MVTADIQNLRNQGIWKLALSFTLLCLENLVRGALQSSLACNPCLFYGTATWLPTILVSKGYTLSHAGLVVSITGFLGSAIGIAAPHYASKLKNMRVFLFLMGLMVTASFAALILIAVGD